MRKALFVIGVLSLLGGSLLLGAQTVEETSAIPAAMPTAALSGPSCLAPAALPFQDTAHYWGGLPRCSRKNGTWCSSPGSLSRCELAPGEPEICVCQSSNTWLCPA